MARRFSARMWGVWIENVVGFYRTRSVRTFDFLYGNGHADLAMKRFDELFPGGWDAVGKASFVEMFDDMKIELPEKSFTDDPKLAGGRAVTRREIIAYGLRGKACSLFDFVPGPQAFTERSDEWVFEGKGLLASRLRRKVDHQVDDLKEKLHQLLVNYSHQLKLQSLESRVSKLEDSPKRPRLSDAEPDAEAEPTSPAQDTQMTHGVADVLESLSLSCYIDVFVDNGFDDLSDVLEMTDDNFFELGVAMGHKLRILKKLRELRV